MPEDSSASCRSGIKGLEEAKPHDKKLVPLLRATHQHHAFNKIQFFPEGAEILQTPSYIFEQHLKEGGSKRGITLQSTVLSKAATWSGGGARERGERRGSDLNLEDLLKTSSVRLSPRVPKWNG